MDDLLNVFLGVDGSYITAKMIRGIENVHMVYVLDVDMDVSLKELASKLLPLRSFLLSFKPLKTSVVSAACVDRNQLLYCAHFGPKERHGSHSTDPDLLPSIVAAL